ncbi:MAG: TatD family hydrolase [Phycisphaerales bacterium]|jgi:TatD DNase family protein|nr:TatD family hydrolase [Phycisphaerales bacterium]
MNLIDTHCHLADKRLARNIEQVISDAVSAGVRQMISAAANLPDARIAAKLAETHPEVFCTAGVHPHHAAEQTETYLAEIEQLASCPRNVAIGEIGLDYHYDYSPRPRQQESFAEQLALADRLGKVIVIHTREAFDDTMSIIRNSGVDGSKFVFHSFTGGIEQVRELLDIGAMVSYSGIATFKTADDIRQGVAIVPDDRIFVETDSPYLSPVPVRNVRTNQPAYVAHVARCLAEVRGVSADLFADQTTANAKRFFGF